MSRAETIPATTKENIFFETEAAKKQFIAGKNTNFEG